MRNVTARSKNAVWVATCFYLGLAFVPVAHTFSATTRAVVSPQQQQRRDRTTKQQLQREAELRQQHPFHPWNRLFVSVPERPDPIPMHTSSSSRLPSDFPPGCLLRLGPNGAPEHEAFMDGDGMIHCITFPPSPNESHYYSATYVQTRGRTLEQQATNSGRCFGGTLCAVPRALPMLQNLAQNAWNFRTLQAQKDTCNTALAVSGNRVLALMEQCPPCEIAITNGRVTTIAHTVRLAGAVAPALITGGNLSAHGRTDPVTHERIHVSYASDAPPYLRVDTFGTNWTPLAQVGVDVPAPIMLHDVCLSEHYVVLFDFPLTLRTERFLRDEFPVAYEPEHGARIGLLLRDTNNQQQPIWFDCIPGVILHGINAYETQRHGDTIVVVQALRSEPSSSKGYLQDYAPSFLYEYELNLTTGQVVSEGCLNAEEVLEFPVMNDAFTGRETEAVYCNHVRSIGGKLEAFCQPETGITLDGVTKLSLTPGATKGEIVGQYSFPDHWYGVTEPTVVPKVGTQQGEYVVLIATEVPNSDTPWREIPDTDVRSQVLVLDGADLNAGPLWTCDLPHHVPYGLHSAFVPWDVMQE